jgi:hypothetical protein
MAPTSAFFNQIKAHQTLFADTQPYPFVYDILITFNEQASLLVYHSGCQDFLSDKPAPMTEHAGALFFIGHSDNFHFLSSCFLMLSS